jgi:hypothetical protein
MATLLKLNDDVIQDYLDFVEPNDIINMALTCRRIHAVGRKRLHTHWNELRRFGIICGSAECKDLGICTHMRYGKNGLGSYSRQE